MKTVFSKKFFEYIFEIYTVKKIIPKNEMKTNTIQCSEVCISVDL